MIWSDPWRYRAAASPSSSITLRVDGLMFAVWTRCQIIRDLGEICGSYTVECHDLARAAALSGLPAGLMPADVEGAIREGAEVEIAVDGEPVLRGYVEAVDAFIDGERIGLMITGRDKAGDLVDCAAAPLGPTEFRSIALDDLASAILAPFGMTVSSETDLGEPLEKITVEPGETAMSFLEKATRARGVLIVSDGLGGLVLTRAGTGRAPGSLRLGSNVIASRGRRSTQQRFSDVFVRSQASKKKKDRGPAKLDVTAEPLTAAAPSAGAEREEARAVGVQGHARDPGITRWRPTVRLARRSSTVDEVKTQADWYVRNARGAGITSYVSVAGYRADGTLWRPNEMTTVVDPWTGVDGELLVAGVSYTYGERGALAELRMTGRDAYDVMTDDDAEGDDDERTGDLDGTAEAL